jgi:two-component system cell cycle sensor histidine kinase/response regulator CckA
MSSEHRNGNATGSGMQTEQALRASELSYRRLFETAKDGILILDADTGRISDVNPFLVELLGFSHDEMIGKTVGELSPFKDILSNQAMLERLQMDGYIRYEDLPLEKRDGHRVSVEFVSNVYQTGDKKVIQCNIRDITERKRTEAVMFASEARYRRLFEAAKDGILILHASTGRIVDVNPFLAELLGDAREAFIGKHLWELGFFKDIAANEARFKELQAKDYIRYDDLPLETSDGRRIDVEFVSNAYIVDGHRVMQCNIRDITGRKRAEERLKQSEHRFREMLGNLKLIAMTLDKQGKVTFCNDYLLQLTGHTRDEIMGADWFEKFIPETEVAIKKIFFDTIETGAVPPHHQNSIKTASGERRDILWNNTMLRDGSGNLIGSASIGEDVTERKRAEDELLWKTAFLEAQVDSSLDGILVVDSEAKKILQNQRMNELWKIPPEISGNKDDSAQLRFVAGRTKNPREFADKVGHLNSHPDEVGRDEIELKDGTFLDRYSAPVRDKDGKHYGRIWTFRDITERKRAEESLRLLESAVEQSKESIVITDAGLDFPGPKIIFVNPAFTQMTGYTAAEAIGKSPRIMQGPRTDKAVLSRLRQNLEQGEAFAGEAINYRKDGTEFDLEWQIAPLRDAGGKTTHFVATQHDITERRRLEARFIEAQKMEVIGRLAGGVAHDFNNIIAIIMGYGNLITSGLDPDSPLQKYAGEIQHAADRAAGLTRQLLIFSRKQKVQPVVLDLNDTVRDLEKMLRRLIDENIEMTIIPGKQTGYIKADAGYVGQVLMNLVVNARDAMSHGGKLVIATGNVTLDENHARSHKGVIPGDYVMLAVSDTGTGMNEEIKAHLFEAFFTTKPNGKGTGLGLATCQTIVQQSGGHIGVDSEVGRGTTFKIYFPRVDHPLDPGTQFVKAGPLPRGTETLLVVEDEPSVRHLACGALEAQGYKVLSAANGQDALRVAGEHQGSPIRLVVTDVIMPLMGGKAMAEWLKITHPDLKILFSSGYTDDAIARHGVLEPGVSFLSKPYTPAILARKVRAMLDTPQTQSAQSVDGLV